MSKEQKLKSSCFINVPYRRLKKLIEAAEDLADICSDASSSSLCVRSHKNLVKEIKWFRKHVIPGEEAK